MWLIRHVRHDGLYPLMKLTPQQRTFLINEQIIGPAIINFGFNALDAWIAFRNFKPIPMWALPGVMTDLIGVLFGLPLILSLITTPVVRRFIRKGKVQPLPEGPEAYPILRLLPATNFRRSLALGIVSFFACAPFVLLGLWLVDSDRMSLTNYVLLKGTVTAVLAAILAPIVALYVMAEMHAHKSDAERGQPVEPEAERGEAEAPVLEQASVVSTALAE